MLMRVDILDSLAFLTREPQWSYSVVTWSHDVSVSTVRVEPLDDLEMTILTRVQHWS